jgi:hypothetical protein
MAHEPLETQSTMDHPAARIGGHQSEATRSPELGLWPLLGSDARRRGMGVERGGW